MACPICGADDGGCQAHIATVGPWITWNTRTPKDAQMHRNVTGKAIYLNADRSAVVDGDSAEAAFLLVGAGCEIPDTMAARYGLGATPEAKAVASPPEDKALRRSPAMKAR